MVKPPGRPEAAVWLYHVIVENPQDPEAVRSRAPADWWEITALTLSLAL